MPSPGDTAYPTLKETYTPHELSTHFTPTHEETMLARRLARSPASQLAFLILLKTFQRLGYFVMLRDVPTVIGEFVAQRLGFLLVPTNLERYDSSGARARHMNLIRVREGITAIGDGGHAAIASSVRQAAQNREDLVDLINHAVETLVRHRYELPGFTVMVRAARRGRSEVNQTLYTQTHQALGERGRAKLERLWKEPGQSPGTTLWQDIKKDPGKATLTQLRTFITHWHWLTSLKPDVDLKDVLREVKRRKFADEAKWMDAARMAALRPERRMTLAACLLEIQTAKVLDDLTTMFVRRMGKIHEKASEALETHRAKQQKQTDGLVSILKEVVAAYRSEGNVPERFTAIERVIGDRSDLLLEQCEAHEALADDNYALFLWRCYASHRKTLFDLWQVLPVYATSQDTQVMDALAFVLEHQHSLKEWLPVNVADTARLNLSWVPEKFWKLVTGEAKRTPYPQHVNRRHFEVCVFSQLRRELKAGDACVQGSLEYADYREQLISEEEYQAEIGAYAAELGLPTDPKAFVAHVRSLLEDAARHADASFPDNDSVSWEGGKLVAKRAGRTPLPSRFKAHEATIKAGLDPTLVLDALVDSDALINWTRFFGPLSGLESKLDDARKRYLTAVFCYGCNVGPSETARSLAGTDRRQIAWVNYHHITEESLDRAINEVINAYNRFALPKFWGTGKTASADGKKWSLYEQNLLSEYHVRYGGYGALGYYRVSDMYIALFSHFISCGVWEAVYILDGMFKKESEIQPDTLYADTQGQSTPVFGLAFLLGIDLLPRIRSWQELTFFRPDKWAHYQHIDGLFTEVINWQPIETHLHDSLRVALSIQLGRISPSTILKRLGTYSRKNRLYFAMRELGRVMRTVFLLRYMSDPELQRAIQVAINKSEQFHRFLNWVAFGSEVISVNDRDEARKRVKYQHLVANCLIFDNVLALTRVIRRLQETGAAIPEDVLAHLSPYLTEHVNRYGSYTLNLDREPPEPEYDLAFKTSLAAD
jgi:TnpA family transposase